SFLFGDLHPHVMGLPLVLTVVTLAVAWRRLLLGDGSWRPVVVVAGLTGLVVGAARTVNTWDLPLLAVMAAAPVASVLLGSGRRVASAAVGGAAALLAWAPYVWRTEVSDAGFELEQTHTGLANWLSHWGYLAVATVVVLAPLVVVAARRGLAFRRARSSRLNA